MSKSEWWLLVSVTLVLQGGLLSVLGLGLIGPVLMYTGVLGLWVTAFWVLRKGRDRRGGR